MCTAARVNFLTKSAAGLAKVNAPKKNWNIWNDFSTGSDQVSLGVKYLGVWGSAPEFPSPETP